MTPLVQRALARLPLAEEDVEHLYALAPATRSSSGVSGVMERNLFEYIAKHPGFLGDCGLLRTAVALLCESHERLRAELEGAEALLKDAEREVAIFKAGLTEGG